jgi:hypothetical protein
MKVRAKRVADFDACKEPGDYFLTPPNPEEGGCRRLSFLCPCGCGDLAGIKVRDDGRQEGGAWAWNRDEEQPTCTPSILIGPGQHWHGYLTRGEFVGA